MSEEGNSLCGDKGGTFSWERKKEFTLLVEEGIFLWERKRGVFLFERFNHVQKETRTVKEHERAFSKSPALICN